MLLIDFWCSYSYNWKKKTNYGFLHLAYKSTSKAIDTPHWTIQEIIGLVLVEYEDEWTQVRKRKKQRGHTKVNQIQENF